jgi:hypothetical protein
MTEEKAEYQTKDKGNGKDQEQVIGVPKDEVELWFMIGVSRKTGEMIITGPKVEELQKFGERKTRQDSIDLLIEALYTVSKRTKESQKKSSILQIASGLILPRR